MIDLDDRQSVKKLDAGNIAGSIQSLGSQCQDIWQEAQKLSLPANYQDIDEVAVVGMGGSGLPTRIITSLFGDQLKVPLGLVNTYELPTFVNEKTFLILSSYSGNTEEVLEGAGQAKEKGAKVVVIASGGKLAALAETQGWPALVFEPKFNPSGQPRMALGYSIVGQLAVLAKLKLVEFLDGDIKDIVKLVSDLNKKWGIEAEKKGNFAKQLALQLYGKIPILLAAEFLRGNAHTFANQINENAKTFATSFSLPEADHHLIEGLSYPAGRQDLVFVLFESSLYDERIRKRFEATKNVIVQNRIGAIEVKLAAGDRLLQSFEFLTLSSWTSFYLAISNGINPTPIPWVDYLKDRLAKP